MKIKIGSRDSRLAVIQAQIVIDYIENNCPGIDTELITMKTTGDMILDRTLDKVGGKGLFVKELDRALKDGAVDLTVHSFKDMPMDTDEDLPIVAVSAREDPRDALILPEGAGDIDFSKPIGCSSARRAVQLMALYPGCVIEPIRGNVLTRLKKLDAGGFSAIVLACAGLSRLGLSGRISRVFEADEILPSACQGMLAVQARKGFDVGFLGGFNNSAAWAASLAERAFVRALGGGCGAPVAAYAEIHGETLALKGMFVDDGGQAHKLSIDGPVESAGALGIDLAVKIKEGGAERVL